MSSALKTLYREDLPNKKMHVTREFKAPQQTVWRAWTEPELLDQWWAPKPWKAVTISMDFRPGGRWRYDMQGPESECHHCLVDYKSIAAPSQFQGVDAFCNAQGEVNREMPQMEWAVRFIPDGENTRVEVDVEFASEEEMKKIVDMGFREGFAMAHENLDQLLKEGMKEPSA
jgi:uncharacterized protein YndB with AHSA1/START domain